MSIAPKMSEQINKFVSRIVRLLVLVQYVRRHLYRCGHNSENWFWTLYSLYRCEKYAQVFQTV